MPRKYVAYGSGPGRHKLSGHTWLSMNFVAFHTRILLRLQKSNVLHLRIFLPLTHPPSVMFCSSAESHLNAFPHYGHDRKTINYHIESLESYRCRLSDRLSLLDWLWPSEWSKEVLHSSNYGPSPLAAGVGASDWWLWSAMPCAWAKLRPVWIFRGLQCCSSTFRSFKCSRALNVNEFRTKGILEVWVYLNFQFVPLK